MSSILNLLPFDLSNEEADFSKDLLLLMLQEYELFMDSFQYACKNFKGNTENADIAATMGFESNQEYNEIMFLREITHSVNAFNDISAFRYASTLKPSPAALSCIVDMLNEYIDTHYPDKKEYIHIDASGSDEEIVLDYARISSAVCCLISNAIDASDFIANPAAMVLVNMDTEISGSHKLLTFDITNIGSAPSPDIADSMTKPFHSDKSGHLGLGLAIVSETAAAMNGTLEWTHQNGITCFTLKIPY